MVVCDTNIWYGNKTLLTGANGTRYIGTFINVFELAQTQRWKAKQGAVRSAAVALLRDSVELRMDNPFARIAGLSGLFFEDADDYSAEDRIQFLRQIVLGASFTSGGLDLLVAKTKDRRDVLVALTKEMNTLIQTMRDMRTKRQVSSKRVDLDVIKILLALRFSQWAHQAVNPESIRWTEIELFLHSLHQFIFGRLAKHTAAQNDVCDLLNLLYVKPGEKYWTLEKYWNEVIAEAGMSHYLFQQPKC